MPQRIVIGANAHAELATMLAAARPDLEIRGNRYIDLTPDDLSWGDSYLGFRRPPLPSMGNIQWVHCTGAGVDSWLYPDELPREILLTRVVSLDSIRVVAQRGGGTCNRGQRRPKVVGHRGEQR